MPTLICFLLIITILKFAFIYLLVTRTNIECEQRHATRLEKILLEMIVKLAKQVALARKAVSITIISAMAS